LDPSSPYSSLHILNTLDIHTHLIIEYHSLLSSPSPLRLQKGTGFLYSNYYASTQLDRLCAPESKPKILAILAKLHGLICLHIADAEPHSPEAKRRLTFFVNSLFMDMPKVLIEIQTSKQRDKAERR
jgi:hypothetical protein